jgi:carboxyl-terminal processing protease
MYVLIALLSCLVTTCALYDGEHYSKLTELEQVIDAYFVDPVDSAAIEDAAAEAMVEALGDRWSHYMTQEEFLAYREKMRNAYVGVGITVQAWEDGYIHLVRVEAGGPAEEAGLLPGDTLTAVDGQNIYQLDIDTVKDMVRGESGTQVQLTVQRDGQTLDFTVERRTVQTVVVKSQMLPGDVGLVTIVNFDDRCARETLSAVDALRLQGAKALIFDVRYNPGGYKHELVAILDYLLPEGVLFRSVDYAGKESIDESNAACVELPMAVLINGDSYSAAEFFAAALSEYGVAKLVGEPTTGKGHFQSTYMLSDGSAVTISVGKYCTPNGVSLDGVGLTPDIPVEVDDELYMNIYYGYVEPKDDPQIQAALNLFNPEK